MTLAALVGWIGAAENELPIPIVAGMAHYQFVTIHPFFDGNGTARALVTWLLYRSRYDLGRFYALEPPPHHNFYEGRADADITPWLDYKSDARSQRPPANLDAEGHERLLRFYHNVFKLKV